MPGPATPPATKSGILTAEDGAAYIPSSKRADGSTRKEIKVRPGYKPPEDVETYKNRTAEAYKNRGSGGGVPGADPTTPGTGTSSESKSKNAKRREAAKRKDAEAVGTTGELTTWMKGASLSDADEEQLKAHWRDPSQLAQNPPPAGKDEDAERQKKIRNLLKKLKGVRELKDKKAEGEKLSPDQLIKIGKETELLRDLRKLGHEGPEVETREAVGD